MYHLNTSLFSLKGDWFGNCLYDVVHPDDVEKVREQLSTTESQNTGRILDLKSKYKNANRKKTWLGLYNFFFSLIVTQARGLLNSLELVPGTNQY